jgi:hypothetical protein
MGRIEKNTAVKSTDLEKAQRMVSDLTGLLKESKEVGLGSLDINPVLQELQKRRDSDDAAYAASGKEKTLFMPNLGLQEAILKANRDREAGSGK